MTALNSWTYNSLTELIKAIKFRELVAETHDVDRSHKILCPMHDDHHPSCHIYDSHAHCFACDWHADALDWLVSVRGMNRSEAIAYAKAMTGAGYSSIKRPKTVISPKRYIKPCDAEELPNEIVEAHLERVSRSTMLPKALEARGFNLADIKRLKIAPLHEDAILAITNPQGEIVALKQRHFQLQDERRYSYLTPGYGTPAWCSPNLSEASRILVIEGELNGMICYLTKPELSVMGIAGSSACLWLEPLKDKTVYVYADGDKAGDQAREKWAKAAQGAGANKVYTVDPWEMDACDIAGKLGKDGLREWLE